MWFILQDIPPYGMVGNDKFNEKKKENFVVRFCYSFQQVAYFMITSVSSVYASSKYTL